MHNQLSCFPAATSNFLICFFVTVFQQKVTRTHPGNEKLLNAVRKPGTELNTFVNFAGF